MSVREAARRIAIWGLTAAWYAGAVTFAVLGDPTWFVTFFAFPLVGALILTSRPDNGIGWALAGVSLLAVPVALAAAVGPALPPWAEAVGIAATWPFWLSLPLIGLLFPHGRIGTRLGWWLVAGTALSATLGVAADLLSTAPLAVSGRTNPWGHDLPVFQAVAVPASTLLQGLVAVGVLVEIALRWRRADAVERLQFRWLVFSLCLVLPLIAGISFAVSLVPGFVVGLGWSVVAASTLNLVPVAIWIAVTRHGLYEIGRVVSRTVAYGAVTIVVIAVYAIVVTSFTLLLPGLPAVGVALATLAAAALFLPVLRGVRALVDRRFDRERVDAERVVDAFGAHLRNEPDPGRAGEDLLIAVTRAVQPATVALWRSEVRR